MGDIAPLLVKSLQTIILSPKIRYAVKHAKCPNSDFCSNITSKFMATKVVIFV